MRLIIDLFMGKVGLAKTFWLWSGVGGILFGAGYYVLNYLAVRDIDNGALVGFTYKVYPILLIVWGIFISIAVINSAGYNRKRKFWGWAATAIAVLSLFKILVSILVLLGVMPLTWKDLSRSIRAENLALPAQIAEGLTLHEMRLNQEDSSLTYFISFDTPTLNNNVMDTDTVKSAILEGCVDFETMLSGPVKKIIYRYEANDGTLSLINIFPKDCGL